MQFKLKVVQGALKRLDGSSLGTEIPMTEIPMTEIPVTGRCFVIGTARNCHMRCAGKSISPYHCIIMVERDRVVVRDDASQGGTFVNGVRIQPTACLYHGDRLRVGKLEFDIVLLPTMILPKASSARSVEVVPPLSQRDTVAGSTDTVADLVVDLLVNADADERDRRRFDPASREFHPPTDSPVTAASPTTNPTSKARVPTKRPPAKLPAPPPVRGQDTIDAAEKALSHLLTQATRKRSG